MVSFDVKSRFTNVLLEYAIVLVLERIYSKGELVTNITTSFRSCACRDIYDELRKVVSP